MSELILQALADQRTKTAFFMVRFGNVLASSGSVVPLFREQIAKGGPITVTHPEVTRYFMTISEAASLVVQAAAMGVGGEVFVLEMGEPVRIADLAERMIHLAGLRVKNESNPKGDIEIVYTGMRPGEKLHEELLISTNVVGTEHPMVKRAQEEKLSWEEVRTLLDRLQAACDAHDAELVRSILAEAVSGYIPKPEPIDWVKATVGSDRLRVVQGGVGRKIGLGKLPGTQ